MDVLIMRSHILLEATCVNRSAYKKLRIPCLLRSCPVQINAKPMCYD
jgi:hypothetical protein